MTSFSKSEIGKALESVLDWLLAVSEARIGGRLEPIPLAVPSRRRTRPAASANDRTATARGRARSYGHIPGINPDNYA